jgi:DNA processing protein
VAEVVPDGARQDTRDRARRVRVMLSFLADAGDPVLGAALQLRTAAEMLAAITCTNDTGGLELAGQLEEQSLARALAKWRRRLPLLPSVARLAAWQDRGLRLACPGDSEWPAQLGDLGVTRPLVLWIRGSADIGTACITSVAVVGARAATAYGHTAAMQLGAELAEHGYTVVSGAAYGTCSKSALGCAHELRDQMRRVTPGVERRRKSGVAG